MGEQPKAAMTEPPGATTTFSMCAQHKAASYCSEDVQDVFQFSRKLESSKIHDQSARFQRLKTVDHFSTTKITWLI